MDGSFCPGGMIWPLTVWDTYNGEKKEKEKRPLFFVVRTFYYLSTVKGGGFARTI